MNRIHIPMTTLAALLALAGCAKEFENTTDERDSAAIELSSVSTDPMTKAVITGTSFTTDEAAAGIGLFLLDGSGNAYGSNSGNVRYGYSDGKWTAASPLRIGNTAGILYGYYPYSETSTNVKAIPVASSINGTDYLFGNIADLTSANAKTGTLTLSHALTRLRITLKRDASFVGDGILSSLTIEGDGIAASGTLDATTGIVTATKSAFTVSGLNASISTGLTEDCLVVPAAASNTPQAVTLKFIVDGKAYKVDLKDELAVKLQSGIQTVITLTVKNTSVSIDGSSIGAWGDGGSQTVTVGGDYTVTVKLHKGTPANEVLVNASLDKSGNSVVIKASNETARNLICLLDDGNSVEPVVNGQYFTFTISNITKDITATVRYESYKLKAFVYPTYSGTIISEYETEHQPGDNITLEVTSSGKLGEGGKFVGWKDKNGELISEQTSFSFDIESDSYPVAVFDVNYGKDVLDGVFTVTADKGDGKPKKVRFSKGNLWYGKTSEVATSETFNLEDNQWEFQTSPEGKWVPEHVSHFFWCCNAADSYQYTYYILQDTGVFFTNTVSFAMNGVSAWHTLSKSEWEYLFGDSPERSGKHKTGVTVNGQIGLVIAPDNFEGILEGTYSGDQWDTAEKSGLVFLPATGYRNEDIIKIVLNSNTYYWSSTQGSKSQSLAWSFNFDALVVDAMAEDYRNSGNAIRLVTEAE